MKAMKAVKALKDKGASMKAVVLSGLAASVLGCCRSQAWSRVGLKEAKGAFPRHSEEDICSALAELAHKAMLVEEGGAEARGYKMTERGRTAVVAIR